MSEMKFGPSIGRLICSHATERPDTIAIAAPGRPPLTYSGLLCQILSMGRSLAAMGIGPEDVVATVMPEGAETATAFLGIAAHAVVAPLNPSYREREFAFFLGDLRPKALLVHAEATAAIEVARRMGIPVIEVPPVDPGVPAGVYALGSNGASSGEQPRFGAGSDVALILHTSGTTSRPKIVPLTHANLCVSAGHIASSLRLEVEDRGLIVMPLFHCHGLVGALLSSIAAGASVVCAPGFRAAEFLGWVRDLRPTWYTAVPSMHQGILARAGGWDAASSPLRFIRSCSSPLPPAVMSALETTFAVPVIESYGMTEATHQMASNPLPPGERKSGSVGLPSGVEIAIVGPEGAPLMGGARGEIVVRGPQVTPGYRGNDEANEQAFRDGWFRTGDLGYVDDDGYLFITGRLKEIINRAGEKIAPREVEEVLLEHPAVEQAIAFAMPDPQVGEEVAAAVVLRPGASATERELQHTVSVRLAGHKVPRRIGLLDEIPKGPTGKPQRIGLADKLGFGSTSRTSPAAPIAPRNELEARVARIWAAVLGIDRSVGIHESFFDAGGDSILAGQLLARVRSDLGVALSFVDVFRGPTVAELATSIEQARVGGDAGPAPIPHVPYADGVPLSFAQQRMWYLEQLYPKMPAYRPVTSVRFLGPLRVAALERALTSIVERHDALRGRFEDRDGVPVQFILPPTLVALPVTDLRSTPASARDEEARRVAREEAWQPFDLYRGPMYRARLLRLDAEDHVLLVTIHHIAFDAWSRTLLLRELAESYNATCRGVSARLPELPVSYAEFAAWQRHASDGDQRDRDRAFWRAHLGAAPPVLELPLDRPRPAVQTFRGNRARFEVPPALRDRLTALAHREGATVAMILFAAFQSLLHRYTGREAIVVGLPIAGRTRSELHASIGLFVNELVIRSELSGADSFTSVLARTRAAMLDAYTHQDLPFDDLVRMLRPARDLGRSPLFQVAFNHKTLPGASLAFDGLRWCEFRNEPGIAAFELVLDVTETPDALQFNVDYCEDVFDAPRMERVGRHYLRLLEGIADCPRDPIARLPMLAPDEIAELRRWNATGTDYPREASVHALFEAEAMRRPDAIAIEFPGGTMTYVELDRRANDTARALRASGVRVGDRVAIHMGQGCALVIGMLATLKAGAAYVPLDPASPRDWLRHVGDDAGIRVALVDAEARVERSERLTGVQVIPVGIGPGSGDGTRDDEAATRSDASVPATDLAYVMWTSGSTGRPKGVAVPHRAIVRLVRNTNYVTISETDRVALVSHPAFDALTFEVWGALLNGATLVLVPKDLLLSAAATQAALRARKIDVMFLTTSLFHHIAAVDPSAFGTVRDLLVGGEVLDPGRARDVVRSPAPPVRLLNAYGPTENTTFSTCYEVRDVPDDLASIPIGGPIANSTCHVLDANLSPLPVGGEGELYVGGDGIAVGYWNRPELTASAFVPDPFRDTPGARLYRTGDLARWLPDGTLQFIGRRDGQVKLRGFRIELREIEFALRQHPDVHDAAVILRAAGGEKELVAYVRPKGEYPATVDLRNHLASRLPVYMIPARWVISAELPLTSSGKLDHRALTTLPSDGARGDAAPCDGTLPGRSDVERRLIRIWQELLQVAPIRPQDDFFELGGHSMLTVRLVAAVEKEFGCRVPIATLLQASTLERMALALETATGSRAAGHTSSLGEFVIALNPSGSLPVLFCVGPYSGTPLAFREVAAALGPDQPVFELQPPKLGAKGRDSIEDTAKRLLTAMRGVQPRGPYQLVGYCLGGSIAYEMACQLAEQGEEIAALALLDSVNYGTRVWFPETRDVIPTAAAGWLRSLKSYVGRLRDAPLSTLRVTVQHRSRKVFLRSLYELSRLMGRPPPARVRGGLSLDVLIAARHHPRRYPGRLLLFRSADPRLRGDVPTLGWGGLARDGVEIVDVPGDHVSILHAPDVVTVAAKLAPYLGVHTVDTPADATAMTAT